MAHIFDEFVKVAILRARPVEFLRFWREIQLYPAINIRSLDPLYLINGQKQLEITMWASQIYILKRFSWPAFETIDV